MIEQRCWVLLGLDVVLASLLWLGAGFKKCFMRAKLRMDLLNVEFICALHSYCILHLASDIDYNFFHTTDLFQYPLKASENQRFSDVFRVYRKRPVAWNTLKTCKIQDNCGSFGSAVNKRDFVDHRHPCFLLEESN